MSLNNFHVFVSRFSVPLFYVNNLEKKSKQDHIQSTFLVDLQTGICVQSLSHVHSYTLFSTSLKGLSRSMRSRLSPGMSSLEQSILLPSGELALGKCILFLLDAVCLGANWMDVTSSQGYPQLYVPGIRLYTRVKTDND